MPLPETSRTVARFRKKPVVIEAIQYLPGPGGNCEEVHNFIGYDHHEEDCYEDAELWITTLEGGHTASRGDWIIKGIQGEFYPCKPAIFEATYEAVQ